MKEQTELPPPRAQGQCLGEKLHCPVVHSTSVVVPPDPSSGWSWKSIRHTPAGGTLPTPEQASRGRRGARGETRGV